MKQKIVLQSTVWRKLSQKERKNLLLLLGIRKHPFGSGVNVTEESKKDKFGRLNPFVRVLLAPAFKDGKFSKANQQEALNKMAVFADSLGLDSKFPLFVVFYLVH